MNAWAKWCAIFLASTMLTAGASADSKAVNGEQAQLDEVHLLIQDTSDSLVLVIEEGRTYFDEDPDRFYRAIQGVLDPVVDFDRFSRGVMGAYYKRATPEQRARFTEVFRSSLVRTYGKALLEYSDERIAVIPPPRPPKNPKRPAVRMEVTSNGKIYPVIYQMRQYDDGSWRLLNIIVNGINIGLTYKNQFAGAATTKENRGNLDAVIDGWGDTIADVEVIGDEPAGAEGDAA